jgi:serine/threonine protein kinase
LVECRFIGDTTGTNRLVSVDGGGLTIQAPAALCMTNDTRSPDNLGPRSAVDARANDARGADVRVADSGFMPPQDIDNVLPAGYAMHEFVIEQLIGEGGFGIVYLARDTQLQRTVAIKEYMPASLAYRQADLGVVVRSQRQRETFVLGMRSFVNEARMLASFDHPALVKVYRFWEGNGTAYMVMPYYEGITLKQWLLDRHEMPDESWLKRMLQPLLEALALIHADHCYHRDIAPDNILLLSGERPLLLDFGAARRVIGDVTQTLTVILKPGYAPIEQYAEVPSLKQGPWTDVYALCAVLYAAITGRAPPPSVGRMITDDMPRAVDVAEGRYSSAFLAAIDRGLAVNPSDRPQSMQQLRELFFPSTRLTPSGFFGSDDPHVTVIKPASGSAGAKPPVAGKASSAAAPAVQSLHDDQPTIIPPRDKPGTAAAPWDTDAHAHSATAPLQEPVATRPGEFAPAVAVAPRRPWMAIGVGAATLLIVAWWLMTLWQRPAPAQTPAAAGGSAAMAPAASAAGAVIVDARPGAVPADTAVAGPAAPSSAAAVSPAPPTAAPAPAADTTEPRGEFSAVAAVEDIVRHADPLFGVNALPDKSPVRIDRDRLQFRVKSSRPGYLYVYLAGTDRSHFYLLFPNKADRNNRVQADRQVILPRANWQITAGGPPGVNHLVAVVTPQPLNLESLPLKPVSEFAEFDMEAARRLWTQRTEPGSPFLGTAKCPAADPGCSHGYGAALVRIEEVQ